MKAAAQRYQQVFSQNVVEKIKKADFICAHVFDLLGSRPTKLGETRKGYQSIDWHSDFKAAYRWDPQIFYKDIKYGHIKGVDIKVPWELSRFQHLNILGQAYLLTDAKKYLEEFVSQVTDWIETNPIGFGVNWACTMDVAIRAANWLVAKEFFDGNALPQEFHEKFYVSIYEHGRFIHGHLENSSELTTNHYIADLAGLLFIALYCPFFEESASWQTFCVNELAKEIQKQVYEDGCDFEASTSYHRLMLEMFFYCELLGLRAGVEFPQAFRDKVRRMFEFALYCIKPNGKIPQIGDNDNGRYLMFSSRPTLDHRYLLSLATIYYQDSQFKLSDFGFDEEAFWVLGAQGHAVFEQLPARAESLKSRAFPSAGWYIMRHNNDYCFVVCGPNGQNGNGGHGHNDKLSFELMLDGEDIVVDPGTYVYTADPEERNKFRSTAYHNTVFLNGFEQNPIGKDLFSLKCGIRVNNASMVEEKDKTTFKGSVGTSEGILKREITLDHSRGACQVRDTYIANRTNNIISRIHLSPGLGICDRFIVKTESCNKIGQIESEVIHLIEQSYDYSSAYGMKEHAIMLDFPNVSSQEMIFLITRGKHGTNCS